MPVLHDGTVSDDDVGSRRGRRCRRRRLHDGGHGRRGFAVPPSEILVGVDGRLGGDGRLVVRVQGRGVLLLPFLELPLVTQGLNSHNRFKQLQ